MSYAVTTTQLHIWVDMPSSDNPNGIGEATSTETHIADTMALARVHALAEVKRLHADTHQSWNHTWDGWAAVDLYVTDEAGGGTIGPLPDGSNIEVRPNVPLTTDGYVGVDGRPGTLDEIPSDAHALAYLMQDGDLTCFSCYGSHTSDCAPIALAVWHIHCDAGGEPTYYGLHTDTGYVVNGSDDVATLIFNHGTPEDIALLEAAGIDRADYAHMLQEDC